MTSDTVRITQHHCPYLYTVKFSFCQDKDDQMELTASNDSLSETTNTKVLC